MPELRCPVCDHPFDTEKSPALPFCSERCQQIDLGRWLDERHGLPYERPYQTDALTDDDLPED
jgi:uncharacterized protein